MSKLLEDLGFQTLRVFLDNYGFAALPDVVDRIYIKTDMVPTITSFGNSLRNTELIALAIRTLLSRDQANHLCAGYARQSSVSSGSSPKIICYSPNVSLNLFKSHEWSRLIQSVGDELILFILTRCSVVQAFNGCHIFLAGNLGNICRPSEKAGDAIDRSVLFHRQTNKVYFCSYEAFEYIFDFHNPEKYKALRKDTRAALDEVEQFWRRLPLGSVFKSYFKDELAVEGRSGILECEVRSSKLVDFLFLVSKKLLKNIFDRHAFRIFKSKISLLVHRNRYESISKNEMIKHFRTSRLGFFRSPGCGRHEFILRQSVAMRFITYIVSNLFVPIISKYFYSTETSFSKFKVHYFPRSSWGHFSNIYIRRFLKNFAPVSKEEVDMYSEMRCIPKKTGARVIVNMSKARDRRQSINKSVYPEFCILREESGSKLGNSVLGYSGMYDKLVHYLKESTGPLYILKLDLSNCFDNIPQDGIINVVREIFKKERYYTKTFSVVERTCGELKCRQVHKVTEVVKPISAIMDELRISSDRIVKENASQKVLTKERVEENIISLIRKSFIKHNGRFFVQKTGIPQGSVLSTLLCSLYYGNVDNLYFNKIFRKGIFVRYVDDFLIITPSLDEIIGFLDMSNSLSHLGIKFSREKIESNFGIEEYLQDSIDVELVTRNRDKLVIRDKHVVWCGSRIYPDGFSIKPHFVDPYFSFSIAHSCTRPGRALMSKMKNLLRNKTSPIYLDPCNKKRYENIYDVFFFYGKKLILFLRRMEFVNRPFVERMMEHPKALIHRICKKRGIHVTREMVEAMASRAFHKSGVMKEINRP